MRGAINNMAGNTEKQLDDLKTQLREEANEKTEEIKTKIKEELPTKEEIIQRFSAAACSPEAQKKAEKAFQQFKGKIGILKKLIDSIKKFFDSIQTKVDRLYSLIDSIQTLIDNILSPLVPILSGVIVALKVLSKIPLPPTAPPGVVIQIQVGMAVAEGLSKQILGISMTVPPFLRYLVDQKIGKYVKILDFLRKNLSEADLMVEFLKVMLDSVFLKFLNNCNLADQTKNPNEDEIQTNDAVTDFVENGTPQNMLDYTNPLSEYYTETIDELKAQGYDTIIQRNYKGAEFDKFEYKVVKV